MTRSPMVTRDGADTLARIAGATVSVNHFCGDVMQCAETLPEAANLINLCQDRYNFTVVFFAALVRGQVNLLPAKRDADSVSALRHTTGHCSVVADQPLQAHLDALIELSPGAAGTARPPLIADDQVAAVAFTSGSTGEPQPHRKTWGLLAAARHVHWRYLAVGDTGPRDLIATVPSWHMYGLEWALMLPTAAPARLYCGADFYPHDVLAALTGCDQPAILVSTPLHLRALGKAASTATGLELIVSATAPIEAELVRALERKMDARLCEIYGCSEVGSLAWRSPSHVPDWEFFDAFEVSLDDGEITIGHPALEQPVRLADRFAQTSSGGFTLQGRATDIVKVAGQRESLAHLNTMLSSIEGVDDGMFYRPEDYGLPASDRLAAVVVAPGMTAPAVRAALAERVSSTFLPRPIHLVDRLPRDDTSKLKRDALGNLLHGLQ